MNHLELFSGIGGFRRALDLLTQDGYMDFESIGYSEIDSRALDTYHAIYNIAPDEIALGDIVQFTTNDENIINLPDFQLLTGGFPCQPFSMMGEQQGFGEDRGQMFFRICDILRIKRPAFVLLENVKNLYTHDNSRTYHRIYRELTALGYHVVTNIFNTADFHLPQKRNRVLIFGTQERLPAHFQDRFTPELVSEHFNQIINNTSVLRYERTVDLLAEDVDQKYFLSERIKPTILSNGTANFRSNSEINQEIARPLTASMHKMHRACQDNYYSQDYIQSRGAINPVENMTKEQLAQIPIRKLTPQEAFALQGFPPDFATTASNAGVNDGALYKQAGNAVSVNTIYAVVNYLIDAQVLHE